MKKLFLFLLAGCLLTGASAQIQVGIKGGVNVSSIAVDHYGTENYGSLRSITGLNAGAFVSFPVFHHFSLQPELYYSEEGAKSTDEGITGTLRYHYFNFPVLFKYNHPSGLFAETGPQVGYLLRAKYVFPNFTEDKKAVYNHGDFSWAFGIGYLYKPAHLGIDIRYNAGLTNFIKETYSGEAKNNVIQVGLFLIFGVKPVRTGD